MPRCVARLALAVMALAAPNPGWAQAPVTLELVDGRGVSRVLTHAELSDLTQLEVEVDDPDGSRATYRGPALRELATLAGAPSGRALRGPAMVAAILAVAGDGYQVGFMLAEVDDQFGATPAIVALARNGTALPESDGPLRMIVPGDAFHARWIRQVVRLQIVDVR